MTLLGSPAALKWQQRADQLEITLPPVKPGQHAYAFRVELK